MIHPALCCLISHFQGKRNSCRSVTYLLYTIREEPFLVLNTEPPGRDNFLFENKNHDGILRVTCAGDPVATRIQLRPHRTDVLTALDQDVGIALQYIQCLAGCHGGHGGKRGRVRVGEGVDALMSNHVCRPGTETACSTEGSGQGANDDIHGFGIHVLRFRQSTAIAAKNTKRIGLVEGKTELVFFLELNLDLLSVCYEWYVAHGRFLGELGCLQVWASQSSRQASQRDPRSQ